MDKNIKIVWILTIITSLLMIGGQSYWLYNQYNFSALEYMQTLHKRILEAEEEEAFVLPEDQLYGKLRREPRRFSIQRRCRSVYAC